MHGHTYRVGVEVTGPMVDGVIADYADIIAAVRSVIDLLDHRVLNEIDGLENPTTERLAEWLGAKIASALRGSAAVPGDVRLIALEVNEGGHICRWTP